jgi:HEPN domain-containing protein
MYPEIGIKPPEEPGEWIVKLNEANITTRYPEELNQLQKIYTEAVVKNILTGSKEVIQWIKTQF